MCRCELTDEGLNHELFECVLNKNWTQMLYSEINESESEVKFPINSDYLLCLFEWSEKSCYGSSEICIKGLYKYLKIVYSHALNLHYN